MLKARDSNASRMLRLITEQFLNDRRLTSWRTHGGISDKWVKLLWDQLAEIWVYIALNPAATSNERKKIGDLLSSWTQNPNCPLDEENYRFNNSYCNLSSSFKTKNSSIGNHHSLSDNEENTNSDADLMIENDEQMDEMMIIDDNNNNFNFSNHSNDKKRSSQTGLKNKRKKKRFISYTIFHRALEASFIKWDDPHLRYIIDDENYDHEMDDLSKENGFCKMKNNSDVCLTFHNSNHLTTKNSSSSSSSTKLFDSKGSPLWNGI